MFFDFQSKLRGKQVRGLYGPVTVYDMLLPIATG